MRKIDPEYIKLAKAFTYEMIQGDENISMPYRFFAPRVEEGREYPLLIYIHGAGERGNDNEMNLVGLIGGTIFSTDEHQKKHPCFIIVPQIPEMAGIPELIKCVDCLRKELVKIISNHPINEKRIYITGVSMGAMATYYLISQYPDLFAAAMPICGAAPLEKINSAQTVPIWAFHAADDHSVPVEKSITKDGYVMYGTRAIVSALNECGHKNLHYTEYPDGYIQKKYGLSNSHPSWEAAYRDEEAINWLFGQIKQ